MNNNIIKKILIIRLSAIGDCIHTLPLAYALRKQFPDIQLDWIVEDKAADFIINNPLLNNVYVLERRKWKKTYNKFNNISEFFNIIKKIRKEKYDIVIDTQQLLKSSVIMGLSGGKRKIALDGGREFSFLFSNEIIKTNRKQFDINYHVVNRNLEIAQYLGCKDISVKFEIPNFDDTVSEEIKNIVQNIDKSKKTIVISPATTWDNKHWTIDGWSEVINEFKNSCNIILTATEKEKTITNSILEKVNDKNIINLTGKTKLSELPYIYRNADILISPDSGSAHIAWLSGCKNILTLFFATSGNRTAPFGEGKNFIQSDTKCSPCMKKNCKNRNNKNICIHNISSKKIINLVKKVLH